MDTKSRSNKSLTSSSIPFQPGNNRIYLEEVLDRRIYNSAKHMTNIGARAVTPFLKKRRKYRSAFEHKINAIQAKINRTNFIFT